VVFLESVFVLAVTVYVTVPLPVPFVLENVTQVTGAEAVHEQPVMVLTTILLLPPVELKVPELGLIEKVQTTRPA